MPSIFEVLGQSLACVCTYRKKWREGGKQKEIDRQTEREGVKEKGRRERGGGLVTGKGS